MSARRQDIYIGQLVRMKKLNYLRKRTNDICIVVGLLGYNYVKIRRLTETTTIPIHVFDIEVMV